MIDFYMDDVAINLIAKTEGVAYTAYFVGLFKREPGFLDNVSPQLRLPLLNVLEEN